MTHARTTTPPVMRFTDGDTVTFSSGAQWTRGLRGSGQWNEPGAPDVRSDDAMRAVMADGASGGQFIPALPNVSQALPGTACSSWEALQAVVLRPATGAVLYTAALNRVQSFLGNESGVLRSATPTPLALQEVRASLVGTVRRHPRASITYHRIAGRLYSRYAVGQSLHTHAYILTSG